MLKKSLKIIGLIILTLVLITPFIFKKIENEPYQSQEFYKKWKSTLNSTDFINKSEEDVIWSGWAKENITPLRPAPMAGYGKRKGKHYTEVHDSIYVRVIALKQAAKVIYLFDADLLIVPPFVREIMDAKLSKLGIPAEDIHISATHSHNSIGGWGNTITGKLFAGEFKPEIVEMLASKFVDAIVKSKENLKPSNISYFENIDNNDIKNRLGVDNGIIDPQIRTLIIENSDGKKACLFSYGAHATVLNATTLALSRDYPGVVVDSLEKNNFDFAMYMAGAVGSMGPIEKGATDFDELKNQGAGVYSHLDFNTTDLQQSKRNLLRTNRLELPLRDANPRISTDWGLRPWLFAWLFGDYPVYVQATRINNVLMIGLPCDFSGELMVKLDEYAEKKGLKLIITSFNGGYMGYVADDKHFNKPLYETTTMAWYGSQNGSYFSEVVRDIIDKEAAN